MLANDFIALFGVRNLSDPYEVGRIAMSPTKIEVHPEWNTSDTRFVVDIAIMIFESGEIPSSKFIQPICLWSGDSPPSNTEGYVSGWGINRKSLKAYTNSAS